MEAEVSEVLTLRGRDASVRESVVEFGPAGSLVGILTSPDGQPENHIERAVILVNSGIIHRVGPNRLHVTLARKLASQGMVCLRFDLSGIGDSSPGEGTAGSVGERWAADARRAMDHMESETGVRDFLVIGNCSGAGIALLTAVQDSRVSGAALINLQGPRTPLRYYLRLALGTGAFWRRLWRGNARHQDLLDSVKGALHGLRPGGARAPEAADSFDVDGAVETLRMRRTCLLLVSCGWDPGLDYVRRILLPKLRSELPPDRFAFEVIPGTNHDFTLSASQDQLLETVQAWALP